MSFEKHEFHLDGVDYTCTQFGARQCSRVALRVAKYFTALAQKSTETQSEIAIFAAISEQLTETDFFFVCDAFAEATIVRDGEKTFSLAKIFDSHFAGKMQTMLQWIVQCMQFQLGSFFDGAGKKAA